MTLFDNVCTPCVRKKEWQALRTYARKHKIRLSRVDTRRSPHAISNSWWASYDIPLPVVEYKLNSDLKVVSLSDFLRLFVKEEV